MSFATNRRALCLTGGEENRRPNTCGSRCRKSRPISGSNAVAGARTPGKFAARRRHRARWHSHFSGFARDCQVLTVTALGGTLSHLDIPAATTCRTEERQRSSHFDTMRANRRANGRYEAREQLASIMPRRLGDGLEVLAWCAQDEDSLSRWEEPNPCRGCWRAISNRSANPETTAPRFIRRFVRRFPS